MACGVQLYLETNGTRYQPPSSSNRSSVGEQRHRIMSLKGAESLTSCFIYDCCRLEGHYKTNNTSCYGLDTHRLSGRHKHTHMHILRNAGPHVTVSVGPPTSPLGKPGAFFDELLFVSLALIVQHLAVRPLDAHHPLVCPPALVVLQIAV